MGSEGWRSQIHGKAEAWKGRSIHGKAEAWNEWGSQDSVSLGLLEMPHGFQHIFLSANAASKWHFVMSHLKGIEFESCITTKPVVPVIFSKHLF